MTNSRFTGATGRARDLTHALANNLIKIADRVAAGTVDHDVIEMARRAAWYLKDCKRERVRAAHAASMKTRRAKAREAA